MHLGLLLQLLFLTVFSVQSYRSFGVPEKQDRFPLVPSACRMLSTRDLACARLMRFSLMVAVCRDGSWFRCCLACDARPQAKVQEKGQGMMTTQVQTRIPCKTSFFGTCRVCVRPFVPPWSMRVYSMLCGDPSLSTSVQAVSIGCDDG